MVIISPAVDDADPLAAANGSCSPRQPSPAANIFDPAAALSLFDEVSHGTTATATADIGAGTTPWWGWICPPPYYAGSDAYASSPFPPPPQPPLQSHGDDLACYAGSIMDTSFPQLLAPPPVYTQPELSYFYHPPQEPQQGLPSCFAAPFAPEPTTMRPEVLQVPPPTQPASMPPPALHYQQTQATTTGSASVEEASPALAETQRAPEHGTRPAPRRRGRPPKRALDVSVSGTPPVSKRTKRVAVGSNRAASSTSTRTSSAATGSATMPSSAAAGQAVPEQAGGSSSSTGSTSDQHTPQAAIAPPEAMMATGPQYADTSPDGVRFLPTDQELIVYLRMKYARQQMPVEFFKDFDVYQAHPMAIKDACGESQNGCWYAFSRRDRRYTNGKRPARSVFVKVAGQPQPVQVGFWKSNSRLVDVLEGGKKDGAVIGRMTALTFQLGHQPKGRQTGWKMREYTIPQYTIPQNQRQPDGSEMRLNHWVVCQLFYKERPGCTNTESKTDENAISVGEERRPRRGKKSEKDKSAVSVGQKRPRCGRKSKKDKNANPQEDGPGETAAGKSVQGGQDMQPQMVVPAAHRASGCSEQDLCVEDDYRVSDVGFEQQNDAANCSV